MISIRKNFLFSFPVALSASFCLLSHYALAIEPQENPPEENSGMPTINTFNSKIQIGANYTYLTLKPHGYQTFSGSLGGLQASYEYCPLNCFYGGILFEWREGSVSNEIGKRAVLYFDVQERLGYTFALRDKEWLITLFSGFAYRYLGEDFKPKYDQPLDFGYNEFYFPAGFSTTYTFKSWISLGVDFTWMPQVFSTVSIEPLQGAYWNLTKRLDNFYVALPLSFALTNNQRFLLTFKPTYQRWEDGHSTAKSGGMSLGLPGNTYNFYGADLNFAYCF